MANNDFAAWADQWVGIAAADLASKSVRFGDLLPIMQQKPDVMEAADYYTYDNPSSFVASYSTNHHNMGYGDFAPDL